MIRVDTATSYPLLFRELSGGEFSAMPQDFGTASDQPLVKEECDRFIEAMARAVVVRRMETMTVFMLDAHRPFSFLASQAVLVTAPVLGAFFGFGRVSRCSEIMEDRGNIDRLIERIEELVDERDAPSMAGKEKVQA